MSYDVPSERQLGYVRHWASEMLSRVLVRRKTSRPDMVRPVLRSRA